MVTKYLDERNDLPVIRRRKEFAQSLISDIVMSECIQMMNEEILHEIAETDPLDSDRLRVLRLRLETVSQFLGVLSGFVDHYEEIAARLLEEQEQYDQEEEAYNG